MAHGGLSAAAAGCRNGCWSPGSEQIEVVVEDTEDSAEDFCRHSESSSWQAVAENIETAGSCCWPPPDPQDMNCWNVYIDGPDSVQEEERCVGHVAEHVRLLTVGGIGTPWNSLSSSERKIPPTRNHQDEVFLRYKIWAAEVDSLLFEAHFSK